MSENLEANELESGSTESPKKLSVMKIVLIVIAGLLVAGSAFAFVFIKNDAKIQYFLAEQDNLNVVMKVVEERIGDEMKWAELSKDKAISQKIALSAGVEDRTGYYVPFELTDILDNSSVEINTVTDPKKRQASFDVILEILGFEIDNLEAYLSPEKVIFTMPFLNDYLQLKDEDFGKVSEMISGYASQEKLGLENFMDDSLYEVFSYERFEKEYIKYIFDEIPKDAFTSSKEKLSVYGEDMNAEKMEMVLSDKVLKDLTVKLLEKLKADEEVKVFLEDAMNMYELEFGYIDIAEEFETGINELINEVKNSSSNLEITSTIWVHSKNIVQRDLRMIENSEEDYASTVYVEGTQLFKKDEQKWDYTVGIEDSYYEDSYDFTGELSNVKGVMKDNIKFKTEDFTMLEYKAEETKDKKNHSFAREVIFDDGYWTTFGLGWNGDKEYSADAMSSTNEFTIDSDEDITVSVFADLTGKVVKGADFPDEKSETIVDLGSMSENEIYEYIEEEVSPEIDKWMEEVLGDLLYDLGIDPAYLF